MRRVIGALAAAVAVVALSVPLAPVTRVSAAPPGFGQSAATIYHAMNLGPLSDTACDVPYYVFTPTNQGAGPFPAILETNGFGGSKDDALLTGAGKYFASHGYVVLDYSGLGFDGSSTTKPCKIELDSPEWDGKAAVGLINGVLGTNAIVKKDANGPFVGMLGGSYGGGIQFTTAALTKAVRAIVPLITWNDLAYSLTPTNNDTDFVHRDAPPGLPKFEWTELFFADGAAQPIEHPSGPPSPTPGTFTCPGFDPAVCTANVSSVVGGSPTAGTRTLLRHSSNVSYGTAENPGTNAVSVPTMLVQGEADSLFNFNDAIANMREIQATGAPVKLVLQSWGHSHSTPANGELNIGNLSNPGYEGTLVQHWFDRYLKGDNSVSTGPGVEYFQDWVYKQTNDANTAYGQAPSWPVGTTQTLDLSGGDGGALVAQGSPVTTGAGSFVNPGLGGVASYSETSGVQDQAPFSGIPPSDGPGTSASWSTTPLSADAISVGIPTALLHLSAQAPNVSVDTEPTLFAKLYDVAPDGSVELVQRLVSPIRVADPSKPVDITLPGVVHRYAAGHSIRFVAAATDAAYIASRTPNQLTISTSQAAPSTVTLPLLAAASFPSSAQQPTATPGATTPVQGLPNTAGATPGAAAAGLAGGGMVLLTVIGRRRRRRSEGARPTT